MDDDRRRVMLFEDDRTIRHLLRDYLEGLGYEVLAYSEPLHCPVYREDAPCSCTNGTLCSDIVITDLEMPRMTGLDLIAHQQERGCRTDPRNVAIMSGAWTDRRLQRARQLGCRVLHKPFRLSSLERWLGECDGRIDPRRGLSDVPDDDDDP